MRQVLSFQKGLLAAMLMLLVLPACILVVEDDDDDDDYFHRHRWRLEVVVYAERTYEADGPYTIRFV